MSSYISNLRLQMEKELNPPDIKALFQKQNELNLANIKVNKLIERLEEKERILDEKIKKLEQNNNLLSNSKKLLEDNIDLKIVNLEQRFNEKIDRLTESTSLLENTIVELKYNNFRLNDMIVNLSRSEIFIGILVNSGSQCFKQIPICVPISTKTIEFISGNQYYQSNINLTNFIEDKFTVNFYGNKDSFNNCGVIPEISIQKISCLSNLKKIIISGNISHFSDDKWYNKLFGELQTYCTKNNIDFIKN